jgi:SAM-dependent methyltransferase
VSLILRGVKKVQRDGPRAALRAVSTALRILAQNREYFINPHVKKNSRLPERNDAKICDDLRSLGIPVISHTIDVEDFYDWLEGAQWPSYYIEACDRRNDIWPNLFADKAVEHYVSAALLDLTDADTLIDVGANISPWYGMVERIYGCVGYALDRNFPPGSHDKRIGADATEMPLPDGFATKIALHSAYEQFRGAADTRLLAEANRVLRDNGKMVILPLQVDNFYYVLLSPLYTDTSALDYGGAEVVWDDYHWPMSFERWYSVEAFNERVVANLSGFTLKIYYVNNAHEVFKDVQWPRYYTRFAALFEKTA